LINEGETKFMLYAAEFEKWASFNLKKRRAGRDL